jgi:hypothetical protein
MLVAALAILLPRADAAEASESLRSLFLSDFQVLYDAPIGQPIALVGATPRTQPFDYGLFAAEVVAFVAKEVLDDSPDEFAGNSLIPSTLSPSMPDTDHDFGDHCLKVVKDIGAGVTPSRGMPVIGGVGDAAPMVASYAGHAIGAAFAFREVWNLIRNDIVQNRGEGFSLHPKVGSNKVALSLTLRW